MSIPIQHGMIWQGRARHRAQGAGHATMYSTEYRQGSRAGFSGPSDARLTQAPDRKVDLLTCFLSFFLCVFVLFICMCPVYGVCVFFFFFFFSASASKYSCYSGTCCPFVICPLIIIIIIIITVDVAVVVGRSRRIGMTIDRLVIFPVSVLYCFFDRQ